MSKVLLILSDGLRDDTAANQMGYLEHLVENKLATRYTVIGEMPTMSRPLYETVHTGVPVHVHGVTSNAVICRSKMPNIFEEAVKAGKTTGASAYWWVSELYNRAPYDPVGDREVDDASLAIQHGRFYMEDDTPDKEVYAAGALLARRFEPDYLLIHPMGMDWAGHQHGSDSREYRNKAIFQDVIMATLSPEWLQHGYTVIFTSDHGMNVDRMHGGSSAGERRLPLYLIWPDGKGEGRKEQPISQLQIAPTVLKLLALPIPKSMAAPPLL